MRCLSAAVPVSWSERKVSFRPITCFIEDVAKAVSVITPPMSVSVRVSIIENFSSQWGGAGRLQVMDSLLRKGSSPNGETADEPS